jgi:branched-chain amino acid transport system permease protein
VREIVSTHWEHHSLIVGTVAILVVMFAPKGVVGLWNEWIARMVERGGAPTRAVELRTEP